MLAQNKPNPFNPSTTITFSVAERCNVCLDVFDVTGKLIVRLLDDPKEPGMHSVEWNGRDKSGSQVSSGVYFYILKAGKSQLSKKMVLLR